MGFVFVRCRPGPQRSVAETFAPYAADFADYRLDDLAPTGPAWTSEIAVNWKSVRDVDNEGYHVAMAHPALQDLYGANYRDYISARGPRLVDRAVQPPRRPPLERAPLPEDPARPAAAPRGQAPVLGLLRRLPERGLHHDPGGRAVLPGVPARHRPHADPLDGLPPPRRGPPPAPRPLPRRPHRPRDPERGHPALDLVERGDEVLGLRRLPPLRPRMGRPPLPRPPARRAAGVDRTRRPRPRIACEAPNDRLRTERDRRPAGQLQGELQ